MSSIYLYKIQLSQNGRRPFNVYRDINAFQPGIDQQIWMEMMIAENGGK